VRDHDDNKNDCCGYNNDAVFTFLDNRNSCIAIQVIITMAGESDYLAM